MPPPRTAEQSRPDILAPAHLPWMLAVLAAPFCYGAVNAEVQAVLALPIILSLLCASTRLSPIPGSLAGKFALFAFFGLALISLVPLPNALIQWVNPEAARLGERFGFQPRLSLSPGNTVERVWQVTAVFAVLVLAREAAAAHRFTGAFAFTLALALLGLAGTEFWLRADGQGIWNEVRNYPGGTFANRNHFASWLVLGTMFVFGALIRALRHLRREGADRGQFLEAGLLGLALVASVAAVVACGSRGGMLALACGLTYWVAVLVRQKAGGVAVAVLGVVLVGGAIAFGLWGELFMQRLTQDAVSFKFRIWRDAASLAANFPWVGVGIGAFEPVFGIFKTFHGEGTFLFAESEYAQWLVETGAVGAAVAIGAKLRRVPASGRFSRVEIFHGAVAGLVAFAAHATVEFVGHVHSIALLAAALLGVAIGLKEQAIGPAVALAPSRVQVVGSLLLALFLASIALPLLGALVKWRRPSTELSLALPEKSRREALETWPIEKGRAILLARKYLDLSAQGVLDSERAAVLASDALNRSLAWHPLDWQLHLERAWLRIAADPASALPDMLRTMELNPRQARIPLRFAESYARLHPPSALEVLRAARWSRIEDVNAALEIAWSIERSTAVLWEIAPANEIGLRAMQQFGERHQFESLVREAGQQLNVIGKHHRD